MLLTSHYVNLLTEYSTTGSKFTSNFLLNYYWIIIRVFFRTSKAASRFSNNCESASKRIFGFSNFQFSIFGFPYLGQSVLRGKTVHSMWLFVLVFSLVYPRARDLVYIFKPGDSKLKTFKSRTRTEK